jgi:hypothetical protein
MDESGDNENGAASCSRWKPGQARAKAKQVERSGQIKNMTMLRAIYVMWNVGLRDKT